MNQIRKYVMLFTIAGLVVALDQWTKWLVRTRIPFMGTWVPPELEWIRPYARIVNWNNSGTAFGMFQNAGIVFTVLAFIVAGVILYYYPRVAAEDGWLRVAMGLQLGGALGNLTDRLTLNFRVTDFISVGNFPVFNVADSSISVGVVVLLIGVWYRERLEKQTADAGASGAESSPSAQG